MTISETELKARCLQVIRTVERDGQAVDIVRGAKVVARLLPADTATIGSTKPWKRLHGSGRLVAAPEESVLDASDFEASR